MMMVYLLSGFISDGFKSNAWLLWERKSFWAACRTVFGTDYEKAYRCLKVSESSRLLMMQCYKVTK